jgi:hypothetical protein
MTIPVKITDAVASLQAQVDAATPLESASHATVKALQLNAGALVDSIQSALVSETRLDTFVAPTDPVMIANSVLMLLEVATDQSNLSLWRGVAGRAAGNLDQLS